MRKLLFITLVLLLLNSLAFAQPPRTELAEVMGQIETSLEGLKSEINQDDLRQENLERIDFLVSATRKAMEMEPPGVEQMEDEDREALVERYREALQAMLTDAETLRTMVESGAPADTRHQQLLRVLRHQEGGHQNFQDDEQ